MPENQTVAYIVRHGSTELNDENKYRGQLNVPLDEHGREDANEAAAFLADKPLGLAWTSDLSRARETANIILKNRQIKAAPAQALRPLDAGKFAGKSKDDNKQEMDYYHKHTSARIPGGESIDDVNERVRRPLLKAFRAGIRSGKPSLVSTHSSVIHSTGHMLHQDHEAALVEPGGVIEVYFDGKKFHAKPVFRAKNATSDNQYAS